APGRRRRAGSLTVLRRCPRPTGRPVEGAAGREGMTPAGGRLGGGGGGDRAGRRGQGGGGPVGGPARAGGGFAGPVHPPRGRRPPRSRWRKSGTRRNGLRLCTAAYGSSVLDRLPKAPSGPPGNPLHDFLQLLRGVGGGYRQPTSPRGLQRSVRGVASRRVTVA